MSNFADITLLECNRKESVEVDTDGIENSIFTKFAVGTNQLVLSLESRKGGIYVLEMLDGE